MPPGSAGRDDSGVEQCPRVESGWWTMGQLVFRGLLGLVCLWVASASVKADYYDFTAGGPTAVAWINGAYFNSTSTGAGSGTFPAFLQSDGGTPPKQGVPTPAQPISEAYNTTADGVLDNTTTDSKNYAIQVKSIPVATSADGKKYFEFLWDINEPNNPTDRFLSLDALKIYTSTVPNQDTPNPDSLGTKRYDMGDNHILLDYSLFGGSGNSDLRVYIPVWEGYDTDAGGDLYVYLYSMQGAAGTISGRDFAQSGGFDEWGLRTGAAPPDIPADPQGGVVPEPTSLALAGFAGIGLALQALRRRKNATADQAA